MNKQLEEKVWQLYYKYCRDCPQRNHTKLIVGYYDGFVMALSNLGLTVSQALVAMQERQKRLTKSIVDSHFETSEDRLVWELNFAPKVGLDRVFSPADISDADFRFSLNAYAVFTWRVDRIAPNLVSQFGDAPVFIRTDVLQTGIMYQLP